MIDTDKYEGHTPAPWRIEYGDMEQYGETDTVLSGIDVVALDVVRQDAQLIADAPLLLAEVKRLRATLSADYVRESHPEFLKEQWADGYISAKELYEKLMTIRRFIDGTIEHALSWEEGHGGDEE